MTESEQKFDRLRVDAITLRKPYTNLKTFIADLESIANDNSLNLDEIKTIEIHYNKETLKQFINELKGI